MKPYLLSIFLVSALTQSASAILDADSDGMSDVWETSNGFSTAGNANPGQAPTADPDGDGVSNLLESIAGTNPLSSPPPLGLYRVVAIPNLLNSLAFDLQWQQFIGKEYQVQSSNSLVSSSWAAEGPSFVATATPLTFTTPARSAAEPAKFFRVQVGDVDPDSDGLSSAEESILGTDPGNADSDGDGIPDKDEITQGSTPTDPADGGQPPVPATAAPLPLKVKIVTYAALGTSYPQPSTGLKTPYTIRIFEQNIATLVETQVYATTYGGTALTVTVNTELPNISADPNKRYTVQLDLPTIGNDTFSQPYRDWSFFIGIAANTGGAPFAALSGFNPATQQFGSAGSILGSQKIFNPGYESYRAIISPVEVSWHVASDFQNFDDHFDPWTKTYNGKRIFPDFKTPQDTTLRNEVEVVVKSSLTLAGKTIFVKAFDVDDSTSEAYDHVEEGTTPIIDTNRKAGDDNRADYLGTNIAGQFWNGTAWGGQTAQGVVDANGDTKFRFRVGMQPGNNYRVAASVTDESMYAGVQTTNSTATKYLGTDESPTVTAPYTPLLTVWRRLWIENDSMVKIPTEDGEKENDISNDLNPRTISGAVTLDSNRTQLTIGDLLDHFNAIQLNNGHISIMGTTHDVIDVIPGANFDLLVRIAGDFSTIPDGTEFRLYDDDDFGLTHDALPRIDLIDSTIKNIYKPAFIDVVNAANYQGHDYNPRKEVDFYRNHPVMIGPWGFQTPGVWDDARDLFDSNAGWVGNLIAGYQGLVDDDNDPNEFIGMEGITPGELRDYSVVYVETIRDQRDPLLRIQPANWANLNTEIFRNIKLTAAHEIAHHPGHGTETSHHAEGKLMDVNGYDDGLEFSPYTITRLRGAQKWQEP